MKTKDIKLSDCKLVNFLPDAFGGIKKRNGYTKLDHYPGRINSIAYLDNHLYVHAGDCVYLDGSEYAAALDKKSKMDLVEGVFTLTYPTDFTEQFLYETKYYCSKDGIYMAKPISDYHQVKKLVSIENENLLSAVSVLTPDYYIVFCPSDNVYLLNLTTNACYMFDDIFCRAVTLYSDKIYFGDNFGNIYTFSSDYLDNGKEFISSVTLPLIVAKSTRYMLVHCVTPYRVSFDIYGRNVGDFTLMGSIDTHHEDRFDFTKIDFAKFNFCNRLDDIFIRQAVFLNYYGSYMLQDKSNNDLNIKEIKLITL